MVNFNFFKFHFGIFEFHNLNRLNCFNEIIIVLFLFTQSICFLKSIVKIGLEILIPESNQSKTEDIKITLENKGLSNIQNISGIFKVILRLKHKKKSFQ